MSEVEPEVKEFLKKIVQTAFVGLLWLSVNMTLGIYLGLLFIDGRPSAGNLLYYFFMVISLGGLVWYFYRTWKKKFPHG